MEWWSDGVLGRKKTHHSTTPPLSIGLTHESAIYTKRQTLAVDCEPADTLAEVLRNQLNFNGTKVSCEVQVCGACTVLVDKLPVSACTYLAYEARGKNLTTVEGLEKTDGTLHPIQQAFIDEFAFQCGYCTPGMIMATKALLDENPQPDSRRDHPPYGRQHLPLHRLRADRRRHSTRRRHDVEGDAKVSADKKTDFQIVNHSIPAARWPG